MAEAVETDITVGASPPATSLRARARARARATPARRLTRWLLPAILVLGMVSCLIQYATRISFWHDEAFQVLNLREQSPGELISTLGRSQTAPPLFMLALKGMGSSFGFNEYALRFLPLLAGILAIGLYWRLSRRLLPPAGVLVAAGLLALSPKLFEHANEVKQYTGDVLCTTLLLLTAARLFAWHPLGQPAPAQSPAPVPSRQSAAPGRLVLLSLLAGALLWYSETQVFIFAGLGLALLPRFLATGRLQGTFRWLLCLIPAAASFVILYFVSIRWQQGHELLKYWIQHDGLPDYAHLAKLPLWLANALRQLFNYACNPIGPATLALGIGGIVTLWKLRQRELLAAMLLPIVLTLLGALTHRYPFGGSRATMFLVPIVFLLVGCGFAAMLQATVHWRRIALGLGTVALLSGAVQTIYHFVRPYTVAHIRPDVQYVRDHRSPDQAIWIAHPSSWVEFLCYWPEPDALVWGPKQLPQLERAREFWLLVSFNPEQGIAKRQPQFDAARQIADPVEQHITRGGAAVLFRVRDDALARVQADRTRDP